MATANAPALKLDPPAPVVTDNPIMAMVGKALDAGDPDMLEKIMDLRDREEKRQAVQAFNAAFAEAQAEFPIIPKRGKGHGNITYARVEDIMQAVMPVLAKHGLSVRHTSDTANGVTVTATLAHVGGHSEQDTFYASADKTGSKNDVQAIKSTITYGRRATLENLLGLASHGEDDDAFASGGSSAVQNWRALMQSAKTMDDLEKVRADLMRATDMTGEDRAHLGKLWIGFKDTLKDTTDA
ncbi:MAG: ERF family protein [Pseudomonadota bacterium]